MSVLAETLARLKRQAGAPGPSCRPLAGAQTARPTGIPPLAAPELRVLLRRRLQPQRSAAPPPMPGTEIAPGLHCAEQWLPYPDADQQPDLAALRREPGPLPVARERLLCFDTETTGLAGGTGTRAFMIGAADWHGGMLRVRQLTLSALAAEGAMLEAFAGWLAPDTVLLSYNGRCFDAPLLATRYRLARQANPLEGLAHVDLLHAVRRRWRGVWENCRLATVERELLRIVREDDLPGSEAPRAFLEHLRRGDSRGLLRVLAHNRQDVITLARLLERLLAV